MAMLAFHALFPEEAQRECRTVTPMDYESLPNHMFVFLEAFCIEPNCDCRRVMLNVLDSETETHVASINYAFETPEPPYDDEGQMFLDPLNPQSELSEALLAMFAEMIAKDRDYHDRLVRHYEMWKRAINDPEHPAQEAIKTAESGYGIPRNRQPTPRSEQKVGPNEPCPCGSGRKYKKCCRV